jgi:hypothetical protein
VSLPPDINDICNCVTNETGYTPNVSAQRGHVVLGLPGVVRGVVFHKLTHNAISQVSVDELTIEQTEILFAILLAAQQYGYTSWL